MNFSWSANPHILWEKFRKTRNNVIYTWQGNRNPFIDHPEFAKAIWGEQCNDTDIDPEEIEPTSEETIQAIINVLEKKDCLPKRKFFRKS